MGDYVSVLPGKAYRLINHGPLVLVCTSDKDGNADIAPIAWNCPVENSPTRVFLVIAKSHKTYSNISDTGSFVVCVPREEQLGMVKSTGSVSGKTIDKFKKFDIDYISGREVSAKIPTGCVGYIECKVVENMDREGVGIIVGEAVAAAADSEGFNGRVIPEVKEGRTIHHFGGGEFGTVVDIKR